MKKFFPAIVLFILLLACETKENAADNAPEPESFQDAEMEKIPLIRETVRTEAVADYAVKTDNPLNDWFFKVELFETPAAYTYLMKLQFEEIRGEDSLKIPQFGQKPEPLIQAGPEKYSAIIGFKDQAGNFREYKKVYVLNGTLKVTTLKRYAVSNITLDTGH